MKMEFYQNGKRFTFRQNDDILRTSSIIGGDTNGKSIERYIKMPETVVGIKQKHQKSNRPRQE